MTPRGFEVISIGEINTPPGSCIPWIKSMVASRHQSQSAKSNAPVDPSNDHMPRLPSWFVFPSVRAAWYHTPFSKFPSPGNHVGMNKSPCIWYDVHIHIR